MITTEYLVTGMTCGNCEKHVREEVSQVTGVQGLQVSRVTGRLTVTSEQPVDDAAVFDAVAEAGYTAARA